MKGRRSERGSILVTSAVAMSSLILMAGLVIDISHFYVVKSELQNAVDAAALAGASGLNGEPSGIDAAVCHAVTTLNANKYGFNNKQFINGENLPCATLESSLGSYVLFGTNIESGFVSKASALANAGAINFVSVSAPEVNVPVFFATMVIGGSKIIEAKATAGLSPSSNILCDIAPFSVIECDSSSGCSLATTTVYMSDGTTPCPSQTWFTKGCVYTVKPALSDSAGPVPGSYQLLAVSGSVNAATAGSVDTCKPKDAMCVRTRTDDISDPNSNPVWQGINTRFNEYAAGLDAQSFPPDLNITENITYNAYSSGATNRRREVLAPIIRRSQFAGRTGIVEVCARDVGRFLIRKKADETTNEITLEYIDRETVSGRGGYVPGMGATDPDLVVPVLYR
ncbi:MAG: hypothetical protein H0T92_21705 [Pyrinomonadaceae bacterium]|nr:hypothetical protein [Pyrinomonadaceae bacterium]